MDILVNLMSWLLLLTGSFFLCVGGVGLIRFPDFYTRIHAASVTDTGGAIFVLLGLFVQAAFVVQDPVVAIKLVLITFFLLFTGPTASHALAKTALMNHLEPQSQNGQSVIEKSLLLPKYVKEKKQHD